MGHSRRLRVRYIIRACMNGDAFAAMIAGLEAGGLSQREIARRAKVSHATVQRLARGEARAPSFSTVTKIAAIGRTGIPGVQKKA